MGIKVLATSDLHGNLPEIEPCDILLIAGDICPDFFTTRMAASRVMEDKGEQRQKYWLDTVFREWLVNKVPAKHIVAIGGNHDFVFEHPFLIPDLPWIFLRDSEVEVEGIRIYGTPWVPNLPWWAFHGDAAALKTRAGAIPDGVDILLSHGPPNGYGDRVGPSFSKLGGYESVGCKHLDEAILRTKPKAVVCGHIHEGFGLYNHKKIDCGVYNVSHVDVFYEPVNDVIELAEFAYSA